jgi:hypothetical protein
MRIECIANSTSLINYWPKAATPVEELLEVGRTYDVYGLYLGDTVAYEILLGESDNHTTEFPAYMFKVVDNRLSSFFVLGESKKFNNSVIKVVPFISFPEWANDKFYFEKLIDGDKETQEIFNNYKRLFYLEYSHINVSERAILIQDNWVQCSVCTEAWELTNPNFEMCRCPKCSTVFLNPYKIEDISVNKK